MTLKKTVGDPCRRQSSHFDRLELGSLLRGESPDVQLEVLTTHRRDPRTGGTVPGAAGHRALARPRPGVDAAGAVVEGAEVLSAVPFRARGQSPTQQGGPWRARGKPGRAADATELLPNFRSPFAPRITYR